jgi:hypothetical protein
MNTRSLELELAKESLTKPILTLNNRLYLNSESNNIEKDEHYKEIITELGIISNRIMVDFERIKPITYLGIFYIIYNNITHRINATSDKTNKKLNKLLSRICTIYNTMTDIYDNWDNFHNNKSHIFDTELWYTKKITFAEDCKTYDGKKRRLRTARQYL